MVQTPYTKTYPPTIPYETQGVQVPGSKRPGQTAVYRNGIFGYIDVNTPNTLRTMDQVFLAGLQQSKDQPFLGHRPLISANPITYAKKYVWETYAQVDQRRKHVGSALSSLFKKGVLGGGDFHTVGIWSINRPEWQIAEIALHSYGMVSVSLYDTLGKDSVEYIINHAHLSAVFTTSDHIPTLIKLGPAIKALKLIISIDDLQPEPKKILTEWAQSQGFDLMELREVEALGKANLTEPVPATPSQLASICYTSGTTGNPKGVLLEHKALALATQSNLYGLDIPADGSTLSYLPLAHIYGRVCEACAIALGTRIGYFTGDPLRLLEDAQILKPNFFPSVPRVLNRVYQSAMTAGNVPGLKGAIFKKAVSVKLEKLRTTGENTHPLWDKLVFRKIRAVLGGELMLVSSGAAAINPEVLNFLKIAFACDVFEGYGMTETAATCSKTLPGDSTCSGTIGPPQAVNEVKLIDVPAMNYTSEDKPNPRGELLIRGENCFKKYYKDEEKSKEAVDSEGWVHTGDIAEIDSYGRLKIIDRVKNIMKLAQGEYVALEKIENTYSSCPALAQIYVHGDPFQAHLLAVVIPDPIQLAAIASTITGEQIKPEELGALVKACKDERINKHILDIMTKEAKKNALKGFELVKRIHVTLDPFTIEDGTLTPTLKIKRKDAYLKFKKELDALYQLDSTTAKL